MINVVAINSLRNLPLSAEYGFSLIFYYLLAGVLFFLPASLVSAELATAWPEKGGLYVWVREAFGKKVGFFTICLQWFYNICWFPTIMSFIAATLAYCINPDLTNNKTYMFFTVFSLFWLMTFINFLGIKISSLFSTLTAIFGTLLPMFIIIVLGYVWLQTDNPIAITFSWNNFFPDLSQANNLVLLTTILFGLIGMEMSAYHANEVKNPQKDYPKAIFWSGLMIITPLIAASLAIALVIPQSQLSILVGLLQAFEFFFTSFHLQWMMPIIAALIVFGCMGGVHAWILGPSKGVLIAGQDGALPKRLSTTNKSGVPVPILLLQGILFTLVSFIFLILPTATTAFWILADASAILALFVYIIMFAAAIRLRYKYPAVKRSFTIPGKKWGLWLTCIAGLFSCIFTAILGFLPPSQIPVGNLLVYEMILISGVLIGCLLPIIINKFVCPPSPPPL